MSVHPVIEEACTEAVMAGIAVASFRYAAAEAHRLRARKLMKHYNRARLNVLAWLAGKRL